MSLRCTSRRPGHCAHRLRRAWREGGESGIIISMNLNHDDTVEGDDVAPPVPEPDLEIEIDPIPSAGAADIGGRAGDED